MTITPEDITNAQAGDAAALNTVIRELEPLARGIVNRHMSYSAGRTTSDLEDDLMQEARVAIWEGLPKFVGNQPGMFIARMRTVISSAVDKARTRDDAGGVSSAVANIFGQALRRTGGDPYEAETLAQSEEVFAHRRLSKDMARAARIAWAGHNELSPTDDYADYTPAHHSTFGIPDDLLNDSDRENSRRKVIRDAVNRTLEGMGSKDRAILVGTYGLNFGGTPYFGKDADADFAAYLNVRTVKTLRAMRSNAHSRFGARYVRGGFAADSGTEVHA